MTQWRTKDGREAKWSGTIPPGPWCVYEDRTTIGDRNPKGQDPEEGLGAEHESPGSPQGEIAQILHPDFPHRKARANG